MKFLVGLIFCLGKVSSIMLRVSGKCLCLFSSCSLSCYYLPAQTLPAVPSVQVKCKQLNFIVIKVRRPCEDSFYSCPGQGSLSQYLFWAVLWSSASASFKSVPMLSRKEVGRPCHRHPQEQCPSHAISGCTNLDSHNHAAFTPV